MNTVSRVYKSFWLFLGSLSDQTPYDYSTNPSFQDLHLLSSSPYITPSQPEQYAANPTPTLKDFEGLWRQWDAVTTGMVPQDELWAKPINLRNALIFYLGHIPTFLGTSYRKRK